MEAEKETLSDVDDEEVSHYLLSPSEVAAKTRVWSYLHREYLEEQAAREAATGLAAAEGERAMAALASGEGGAEEIAKAAAMAVEKMKMERRQRRAENGQNRKQKPKTALEATQKMLSTKKLSSKVNYTALASLFSEDAARESGQSKKSNAETTESTPDKNLQTIDESMEENGIEESKVSTKKRYRQETEISEVTEDRYEQKTSRKSSEAWDEQMEYGKKEEYEYGGIESIEENASLGGYYDGGLGDDEYLY